MIKQCKLKRQSCLVDNITKEASKISENFIEDVFYRRCKKELSSCRILSEPSVSYAFSRSSIWELLYDVEWSSFTVSELNKGISGLLLDEAKSNEEDVYNNEPFKKFIVALNKMLFKDIGVQASFLKRAITDISRNYKYDFKLVDIEDMYLKFSHEDEFLPKIYLRIMVGK